MTEWYHRRTTLARDGWETVVDDSLPGWRHTGLRVADLRTGERTLDDPGVERIVVPLDGPVTVEHGGGTTRLDGRAGVFSGPTDVLYLSAGETARISGEARVAVASAPTTEAHPTRRVRADEVPVELRGAGVSSRQVQNLGTPDVLDAARLIVCEVITPAGNWSSYPPHKHDENVPGRETRLEEIYWFEVAPTRDSGVTEEGAFALFSTYSSPAGEIEVDARVRTGDTVLVPYGWHGPAAAPPGADLYYLNVMAGPDPERRWLITDDPAHTGIRTQWETEAVDPRLPYGQKGRR